MNDTSEPGRKPRTRTGRRKVMVQIPFVILTMLFIGGYLALYVPPSSSWIIQLLGMLLPAISLTILLFSIIILLRENWYLLGLAGICLLLLAVRYLSYPASANDAVGSDDQIVVMTYNAKSDDGGYSEMARILEEVDPDVIAIQDAPVVSIPDSVVMGGEQHMFPLFGRYQVSAEGASSDEDHHWIHQPVFSNLEILQTSRSAHDSTSDNSPPGSSFVRRVEVRYDSVRFAIYNIHLRSIGSHEVRSGNGWIAGFRYWVDKLRRFPMDVRSQQEETVIIRDMLESEELPFIVCGHLNTTSSNWAYRHLTSGLTDAFRARGKGFGSTYPSQFPMIRIDYILVSREWSVISANVFSSLLSDHLPVVATIALRKS